MQLLQIDKEIELGCVAQKVNTFLKMALTQKRMTDIFKIFEWPQHSAFMKGGLNDIACTQRIVDTQKERFAPLRSLKVVFWGSKAG
jgi:hypothetical protein